jgi:hypothetical protein
MSGLREAEVGVVFLERLLAAAERNPDRSRPASAAPDYERLPTAEALGRFRETMAAAERAGAVEVVRGRRDRSHLIDRVRVKDSTALAKHLGRVPSIDVAERTRIELAAIAAAAEPWVGVLVDNMASRWARGDNAYRLAPSPIDAASEFIRLLASISRDEARGLDARTFSLKVTGDSKAFDRHASRIVAVLGARIGEQAAEKVWSRIGLERFSHPIHLHGCVVVEGVEGILVDGRSEPFASIHPELLPRLRLTGRPTAVLTIENYASFNRHVREVADGALTIYTGGFPSIAVAELLKRIATEVDAPFVHWGDVDPGGIRIFRHLEEVVARQMRPHLMTRELAEQFGRPCPPDITLGSIAKTDSGVADLAEWLAHGTDTKALEQEAIDPRPVSVASRPD